MLIDFIARGLVVARFCSVQNPLRNQGLTENPLRNQMSCEHLIGGGLRGNFIARGLVIARFCSVQNEKRNRASCECSVASAFRSGLIIFVLMASQANAQMEDLIPEYSIVTRSDSSNQKALELGQIRHSIVSTITFVERVQNREDDIFVIDIWDDDNTRVITSIPLGGGAITLVNNFTVRISASVRTRPHYGFYGIRIARPLALSNSGNRISPSHLETPPDLRARVFPEQRLNIVSHRLYGGNLGVALVFDEPIVGRRDIQFASEEDVIYPVVTWLSIDGLTLFAERDNMYPSIIDPIKVQVLAGGLGSENTRYTEKATIFVIPPADRDEPVLRYIQWIGVGAGDDVIEFSSILRRSHTRQEIARLPRTAIFVAITPLEIEREYRIEYKDGRRENLIEQVIFRNRNGDIIDHTPSITHIDTYDETSLDGIDEDVDHLIFSVSAPPVARAVDFKIQGNPFGSLEETLHPSLVDSDVRVEVRFAEDGLTMVNSSGERRTMNPNQILATNRPLPDNTAPIPQHSPMRLTKSSNQDNLSPGHTRFNLSATVDFDEPLNGQLPASDIFNITAWDRSNTREFVTGRGNQVRKFVHQLNGNQARFDPSSNRSRILINATVVTRPEFGFLGLGATQNARITDNFGNTNRFRIGTTAAERTQIPGLQIVERGDLSDNVIVEEGLNPEVQNLTLEAQDIIGELVRDGRTVWSIVEGTNAHLFRVIEDSGGVHILSTRVLDYETDIQDYTLTLRADHPQEFDAQGTVSFSLGNVPEGITLQRSDATVINVIENSPLGTPVEGITITASVDDNRISPNTVGRVVNAVPFVAVAGDGDGEIVLQIDGEIDYETLDAYHVTIEVSVTEHGITESLREEITINVLNALDNLLLGSGSDTSATVREKSTDEVSGLSLDIVDEGQRLVTEGLIWNFSGSGSFADGDPAGGLFTINPIDGTIQATVKTTYETDNLGTADYDPAVPQIYRLQVAVSKGGIASEPFEVSVTMENVLETLSISDSDTRVNILAENLLAQVEGFTLVVIDERGVVVDDVDWTVATNTQNQAGENHFDVSSDGVLSVINGLDYESMLTHQITIQVSKENSLGETIIDQLAVEVVVRDVLERTDLLTSNQAHTFIQGLHAGAPPPLEMICDECVDGFWQIDMFNPRIEANHLRWDVSARFDPSSPQIISPGNRLGSYQLYFTYNPLAFVHPSLDCSLENDITQAQTPLLQPKYNVSIASVSANVWSITHTSRNLANAGDITEEQSADYFIVLTNQYQRLFTLSCPIADATQTAGIQIDYRGWDQMFTPLGNNAGNPENQLRLVRRVTTSFERLSAG